MFSVPSISSTFSKVSSHEPFKLFSCLKEVYFFAIAFLKRGWDGIYPLAILANKRWTVGALVCGGLLLVVAAYCLGSSPGKGGKEPPPTKMLVEEGVQVDRRASGDHGSQTKSIDSTGSDLGRYLLRQAERVKHIVQSLDWVEFTQAAPSWLPGIGLFTGVALTIYHFSSYGTLAQGEGTKNGGPPPFFAYLFFATLYTLSGFFVGLKAQDAIEKSFHIKLIESSFNLS